MRAQALSNLTLCACNGVIFEAKDKGQQKLPAMIVQAREQDHLHAITCAYRVDAICADMVQEFRR